MFTIQYRSRGVPQIEVTFEVDANGILSVRAEDKAAKRSESITITNDKDHLSPEEIERMAEAGEKYKDEDNKIRAKIDAKNKLESYIYNMKSTVGEDKIGDKIDSEDKDKIGDVLQEAVEWLDRNQDAEKEDFDEKMKEVEGVCNPVIRKVYEKGGEDEDHSDDEL